MTTRSRNSLGWFATGAFMVVMGLLTMSGLWWIAFGLWFGSGFAALIFGLCRMGADRYGE